MLALRQGFARAFRHRNFRLLWFGAFLSFIGSFIQTVAQGWLVYEITGDKAKLALVTFCSMAPVSVFGPFAGTLTDMFNKRAVLIWAQALFGIGALTLGILTHMGRVQYWHILAVALLFGFVTTIEVPTRQSLISRVVPQEDLAVAVPLNAMTFNSARIIGPAIGGLLLTWFGPGICYDLNGISFIALIFAVLAITADMRATQMEPQPMGDLLVEGMKYTFRDQRLRTLFIMEALTSGFGLFYASLMPAIATEMLHLSETGYAFALTTVGFGGITGLLLTTYLADRPIKGKIVRSSMALMGVALLLLGFIRTPWLAFPLLAITGASAIMQFNTTNTLFQILSPEHLRGRVLSMHLWALSGLGPIGTLFFGWFSEYSKTPHTLLIAGASIPTPTGGLPLALNIGGTGILMGAAWGWYKVTDLSEVQ
jgi:MFS family permease